MRSGTAIIFLNRGEKVSGNIDYEIGATKVPQRRTYAEM